MSCSRGVCTERITASDRTILTLCHEDILHSKERKSLKSDLLTQGFENYRIGP